MMRDAARHRASRRPPRTDRTEPNRTNLSLLARAMLARAPSTLADALARRTRIHDDGDVDDASTTSALESALADARRPRRDAAITIAELEESRDAQSVAARRAEARAKSLGERLARARGRRERFGERRAQGARGGVGDGERAVERGVARGKRACGRVGGGDQGDATDGGDGGDGGGRTRRAETASEGKEEVVRLRRELGRQAQVIADAYRDEMIRLQRELRESEGKREVLEKENEALRAEAAKMKKAAKAARGPRNTYESPYAYAKYADKHKERDGVRSPLTPRSANVFE